MKFEAIAAALDAEFVILHRAGSRPATREEIVAYLMAELRRGRNPPLKTCPDCCGSGWCGDNGPGLRGNTEYSPCHCTDVVRRAYERGGPN